MSKEIKLGKIESVKFGHTGYQDAMLGISFSLSFDGSGVNDSKCGWDAHLIKCTESCKWTEEDRDKEYAEIMRYISKLLYEAKVDSVDKLKGIPVEVIMENRILKEWRILTEVV